MPTVRRPAVAGAFYPGEPEALGAEVQRFLAEAKVGAGPVPKAIIAPHAGYVYSGAVAATAYARLRSARDRIRRVVLLGPCHRVAVRGLAVSGADLFATPLGGIPIDTEARERILTLPQVKVFDATHAAEHSLEVQLPFLQALLPRFQLVPLVVGDATDEQVAEVIEALWGGPETLIVVSSDLTHYLGYDEARRIDALTSRAIEEMNPDAIGCDQACGRIPVKGLLTVARRRGLRVETVDLRNSGDTAGSKDRVVGYGSWVFVEPAAADANAGGPGAGAGPAAAPSIAAKAAAAQGATRTIAVTRAEPPAPNPGAAAVDENGFGEATRRLLDRHGPALLHLAAASIQNGLAHGTPLAVDPGGHAVELRAAGACFVTLKRDGKLRGCIGSPQAYRPLVVDVSDNGFRAAFKDPRFPKLAHPEVEGLDLSISVLSPSAPIAFTGEAELLAKLRPGIDGLVIEDQKRRALFLPSVWEQIPDPLKFLAHLKVKAGLAADHWSGAFRAWRFVAEEIDQNILPDPAQLWARNTA